MRCAGDGVRHIGVVREAQVVVAGAVDEPAGGGDVNGEGSPESLLLVLVEPRTEAVDPWVILFGGHGERRITQPIGMTGWRRERVDGVD